VAGAGAGAAAAAVAVAVAVVGALQVVPGVVFGKILLFKYKLFQHTLDESEFFHTSATLITAGIKQNLTAC
jgi:hypothetical protein